MEGTGLNGAIPSSVTAASPYEYLKKIDGQAVAATTVNSLADMAKRGEGFLVTKTNTCNGNGAQADNLFTVTGVVQVVLLYGFITEVTNDTTISGNSLNLNDGTLDIAITDAAFPLDLSAVCSVGGLLYGKSPLVYTSNATGAVEPNNYNFIPAGSESMGNQYTLFKKIGVATYIQHLFTGDANTDVDIKWYIQYIPVSDDGAITAV